MASSLFAPLNRANLIAALSQFGSFSCNACIFDSGVYSSLLPWSENPSVALWDLLVDSSKYESKIQRMKGGHSTLEITTQSEEDNFEVKVQGHVLGKLQKLRL